MKRTQSEDREAQNGQRAISASTDYLNKKSKDFMVRNNPLGLAEPSVKRDGYAVGSREGSMYRSTGNLNVSSGVAGSRAGSESKDLPKGNWKERRASTSDLKGSGIRVGGNLVEPSVKPCMPFGSGAGGGNVVRRRQVNKSSQQQKTTRSSSTSRTSTTSTMQQVSTALEQIQVQESRSQVTVALPRGRSRAQSLPRKPRGVLGILKNKGQVTNEESSFRVSLPASARTSRQASVEPEGQKKLTRHGSVEIYDGSYNLTVPNKQSRSSSKTRLEQTKGDHIRIEAGEEENGTGEAASSSPLPPAPSVQQTYAGPTTVEQTYDLPAPATQQQQQQQIVQQSTALQQTSTSSSVCQTSVQSSTTTVHEVQQSSVEQSSSVVQQQNSTQDTFAIQQNAVQQSSTTVQSSSSKQESSHCSVQQSAQQSSSSQQSSSMVQSSIQQTSNQSVTQKQFVTQSAVQQQSSVQQTSVQQSSQQTIQQHSVQQQSVQQQSIQQQSIQQQSVQQQSIQQQSGKQRSRHTSGTQDRDTVVQSGGKFNITQGLNRRSRHQSGSQTTATQGPGAATQGPGVATQGPGAALRGLDTALEKIAAQQKKEETSTGSTTYVAKVSSRQTSRRQSVSATNGEEVTTVTLSLPPSQRGSRQTSRRGSVSEGGGARKSRRGSLDIYTAEYALKIGGGEKKGITAMEQKTAFHMKVENEAESEMELCGRCHLPTHKTKACPEFGTLSCPRCLEWGHWEDSCWAIDHVCERCGYVGHTEAVHDVKDFKQRRAIVDTLGWEPFQDWFYDQTFRGWWQVTGCVGVPLYRIYPRKTAWRTEKPEVTEDEPVAKSSLTRADSVDDMIAQVKLLSQRRPVVKKDSEEDSSGRSTPVHLR